MSAAVNGPAGAVVPPWEWMSMTESFRKGARVKWNWGQGVGRGCVAERFDRHVERMIEGVLIRREGSISNPAYLVRTATGVELLKLASELSRA